MYKMDGWIMKDHGVPDSKVTVIKRNLTYAKEKNLSRHDTFWDCICECGKTFVAGGYDLRNGLVKSCGCWRFEARKGIQPPHTKNLIGLRFGKLVVLRDSGQRIKNKNEILWLCQCDCGNQILVKTSHLTGHHTSSCGCMISNGENKIIQILLDNHIKFIKEKTYKDLLSNKNALLRYDFFIDDRFLLEYDGIQHYQESNRDKNDTLTDRQKRDKIKDEYAKSHNIPLKRIPYWDFDQITLENIMSDKWLINN